MDTRLASTLTYNRLLEIGGYNSKLQPIRLESMVNFVIRKVAFFDVK